MARARWLRIALLAGALAALAVVLVVPGLLTGVLFLSPAILLLASLTSGRYVGENGIRRLAAFVRRSHPRRARAPHSLLQRRPRALLPRGGNLLATSLAVRPPPLPALR
jgi:hypothetical protein